MMNHIFRDMLDQGVIAYIDNILIYVETEEKYDELVKEVLKRIEENGLVILPEKCVWAKNRVEFLGYIALRSGGWAKRPSRTACKHNKMLHSAAS
jgi:hypothetical protein